MAADKKAKKTVKRRTPTKQALHCLVGMPLGELARFPALLVEADVDTARFLLLKLNAALPPVAQGTGPSNGVGAPPAD